MTDAATVASARDPLMGKWGALGQPVSRLDGPLKVAGAARFAAEVTLPGLAQAALLYSTIAKGRVARLDVTAAQQAPGVIAVLTHRNMPRMGRLPRLVVDPDGGAFSDLPVLQDERVHWNGQPIAVVVAETAEQAEHATTLIAVDYAPEPAATDFEALLDTAQPPPSILGRPAEVRVGGDAEAALASAPVRVDAIYRTPRHAHSAIELHGLTALWEGDRLTVHDSTQMLAQTKGTLASLFGLPRENVRVLSPYVGGGFGGKGLWNHTILCVAAARLTGRPVRLVLSREGVFRTVGARAASVQRVALGARQDGTLQALIHTGATAVVSHNAFPEQFSFPARVFYAADNILIGQTKVDLDMVTNCAVRAPGESIGTFALESAVDELAAELSIDPVELRRRIEPRVDPIDGRPFSSRNLLEAYRRGAEAFGWSRREPVPGRRKDGEWRLGMGVATATYPFYRRPGAARIRLHADGAAQVEVAAHEMGMGTATVQTQHAADRLGLPLDKVTFAYGDSDLPVSTVAGGSSQTASIAGAIIAAHRALVDELLRAAGNDSPLSGLTADQVECRDGGLWRRDGSGGETYQAILKRAGRDELSAEAEAPAAKELQDFSMHSYGAQFCEVRVSDITGEVRVNRWLGSFDVGRVLNPKTASSQLRGGIIMGIGMALSEEVLFDPRSGRVMNASLAEYHVPVHLDVPPIEVMWTDIPDPEAPLGLHGIGEIGITGCAAAIANAVYNATGRRVRDLPITLDKMIGG
jgi:xanthine dehydrogenase YagR molybdenum-binding subunit